MIICVKNYSLLISVFYYWKDQSKYAAVCKTGIFRLVKAKLHVTHRPEK